MNFSRAKNAKRNIIYGFLNKVTVILFPFIVRTVMIKVIGEQYLGLNSLFSSILSVLSLAELGFSNAVIYNMYKPVAENDIDTLCALLNYYRKIYRIIGCVILGVGLVLIPFLPNLISGTYPSDINLVAVYLIYLVNTALSYFLYAYLTSLLGAYQRNDVESRNTMVVSTLLYIAQIAAICLTKNYYVYAILMPVFTIMNNLRIASIIKKMYPELECRGVLSLDIVADIKQRISGLIVQEICGVTRNSFDSIFISAFLGLTLTAVYNNYFYIMNSVVVILSIIMYAIKGVIGNSIVTESQGKNYADMNHMNFVYMWISGWCMICLLCLLQPFMKIWMGEKLMFELPVVILLCVYFYVLKMGDIRFVYVDAGGLWWYNRWRCIAEAACNLVLNYVLGKYFGVYGIIVATLISLFFINFCYGSTIIFKYYFTEQKVSEYFIRHFGWMFVTMVVAAATYWVCSYVQLGDWGTLLVRGAICIVVPNVLYIIAYSRYKFGRESMRWLFERIR